MQSIEAQSNSGAYVRFLCDLSVSTEVGRIEGSLDRFEISLPGMYVDVDFSTRTSISADEEGSDFTIGLNRLQFDIKDPSTGAIKDRILVQGDVYARAGDRNGVEIEATGGGAFTSFEFRAGDASFMLYGISANVKELSDIEDAAPCSLGDNDFNGDGVFDSEDSLAFLMKGDDTVRGGSGQDLLAGFRGNDRIDGLAGSDIVYYQGKRSNYTITLNGDELTVVDQRGKEGRDTLVNIETLRFSDQDVSVSSLSQTQTAPSGSQSSSVTAGGSDVGLGAVTTTTTTTTNNINNGTIVNNTNSNNTTTTNTTTNNVNSGNTTNTTITSINKTIKVFDASVTNDTKVVVTRVGDITRIEGNQENNTVVGTDAIDRLFGGGGSDRFYSSKGNDVLDGGDGTDAVTFKGKATDFRVEKVGGNWLVRDTRSDAAVNQGEDTLTGVERIAFEDKVLALDTDGVAGKAYRVYKAAFNRDPMQGDTSGLGFWIDKMDNAMDLIEVSARFVDSNEFRSLYGTNPTNEQFLTKLYTNVLGRQPEASGFNWWLNELNTNPEKTKAKVLADFAESAENQTGVVSLIGNGITYDPWIG